MGYNVVAPRVHVAEQHLVAKQRSENEEYLPIGTEEVLHTNHYGNKTVPIDTFVEDKIRQYVYKNRICLIDFWRDYDRHNCGLITQAQVILPKYSFFFSLSLVFVLPVSLSK